MSEASDTVTYVGDLLSFANGLESQAAEVTDAACVIKLGPGRLGIGPRTRFGLRRGTRATRWYDTGCSLESSDPVGAAQAYERALAGRPDLADAHNNLGRLCHDAGSLPRAEASYRLAICADPNVALYWFNLGVVVEDQGRRAEAITAYQRAIELDDHVANAHFNLARLLELAGRRTGDAGVLRCAVRHLLRYRELTRHRASGR
jgi:tetratricopeptide (TPR) repeat protein